MENTNMPVFGKKWRKSAAFPSWPKKVTRHFFTKNGKVRLGSPNKVSFRMGYKSVL